MAITLTYTLANTTQSDASKVMTNFQDLINAMEDGTKDHNIAALTCTSISNTGNTTLGNSSSDTVTMTGSLASNIVPDTHYGYDLGSNTRGLKDLYFASADSAPRSTKITGATISAAWTLTLPTGVPSATAKFLKANTSGVTSWEYPFQYVGTGGSGGAYNALPGTTHLNINAAANPVSVTVSGADSLNSGQMKWIRKSDATFNPVSIVCGTTLTLNTQGESVQIVSADNVWNLVSRHIPSNWTSYPVSGLSWTTSVNWTGSWRRVGDSLDIDVTASFTSNPIVGQFTVSIPASLSINTASFFSGGPKFVAGNGALIDANGADYVFYPVLNNSVSIIGFRTASDANGILYAAVDQANPFAVANGDMMNLRASGIPISGWAS